MKRIVLAAFAFGILSPRLHSRLAGVIRVTTYPVRHPIHSVKRCGVEAPRRASGSTGLAAAVPPAPTIQSACRVGARRSAPLASRSRVLRGRASRAGPRRAASPWLPSRAVARRHDCFAARTRLRRTRRARRARWRDSSRSSRASRGRACWRDQGAARGSPDPAFCVGAPSSIRGPDHDARLDAAPVSRVCSRRVSGFAGLAVAVAPARGIRPPRRWGSRGRASGIPRFARLCSDTCLRFCPAPSINTLWPLILINYVRIFIADADPTNTLDVPPPASGPESMLLRSSSRI